MIRVTMQVPRILSHQSLPCLVLYRCYFRHSRHGGGGGGGKDIFSSLFVAVSARFWGAAAYSVGVAVATIAVPEARNMQ
jgi:hypothetical protein